MGAKGIPDLINEYDKFIITAHETPDGDAIGSEYAMYRALKQLGKASRIINADPAAHKYNFIDIDKAIETIDEKTVLPKDIDRYCLIILDTNDIQNIGEVNVEILPKVRDTFIIDHHESGEDILSKNIIRQNASSTCEILFDLFQELNVSIDFQIAQALFAGIVYDTGSFIYPKTTAKTFSIAHKLVSLGVAPNDIYARMYESNSVSSLMLQSKVLSSLELIFEEQVAIQIMRKETIIECNALYEEADSIINFPLKSEKIRVSIFFKENEEGLLRCSMRSKGNINVADIAQTFNGGGHKTAAGFKCKEPITIIREKILKQLRPYFY